MRTPLVRGSNQLLRIPLLLSLDDDTLGLSKANPKTDAEYRTLAGQIHAAYIERLTTKPRYTVFVDEFIKHLLASLTDVEARKVNTAVGVIANVKTTEAKDKSSGKKKGGKAKPVLGAGKAVATKWAGVAAWARAPSADRLVPPGPTRSCTTRPSTTTSTLCRCLRHAQHLCGPGSHADRTGHSSWSS